MALFKVRDIIDGKTIKVAGWKGGDSYRGNLVQIKGYDIPKNYGDYVKIKLTSLLSDKSVELKNVDKYIKGDGEGNDIVYCHVFLDEIDISTYFSELKLL